MTFAVTGANGFLGVHIIHHLLRNGHNVLGIIRPNSSKAEFDQISTSYTEDNLNYDLLSWTECELFDTEKLHDIFTQAEFVVHLAGTITYLQKDFNRLFKVNKEYTANVVNVALGADIKKLVYCSSIAAISKNPEKRPILEKDAWDEKMPYSNYGYSKYLGECEVWRAREEGLNVAIINPGIVLGFGKWHKGSNSLFKNAFNQFKFYSNGITGFVGVKDVASITHKLALSKIEGERFILVSENLSFQTIANFMADSLDKRRPKIEVKGIILALAKGFVEVKEFFGLGGLLSRETVKSSIAINYFSNEKVKDALDFRFTPIKKVISEAALWYKKSPPK